MSDDEIYFGRTVTPSELVGIIMMAARISPKAAPGTLLKGERKPGAKRERAPDYLAQVRRCPCLACDHDQGCEAAHVRYSVEGKPIPGVGRKPADLWALPLCRGCHRKQHATGEVKFWSDLMLDPVSIALELYSRRFDLEQMRAVIFAAREKRK